MHVCLDQGLEGVHCEYMLYGPSQRVSRKIQFCHVNFK